MKVCLYLSVLCNKLVLSAWCAYIQVLPTISLYALIKRHALKIPHLLCLSPSPSIPCHYPLLLLQMLSESIMHKCIVRLLRSTSDEDALECFSRLITTTGKELDHPQTKVNITDTHSEILIILHMYNNIL